MGKNPNEKKAAKAKAPKSVIAAFGTPRCRYCHAGTRRMPKPKWRLCENGHRLYKMKE